MDKTVTFCYYSSGDVMNKYACKDNEAIYFKKEESDIRTPFFRDIDRIIYTLSFQRYINKTQVFSDKTNDHLQTRMIHVLYVSKIARTIGRALGLNEDLIEAASLGHDLGHAPFGHVGESILNKISLSQNEGYFNHNIHSVRLLLYIENYGKGKNITMQTLDAIMCHNGEIEQSKYQPKAKTKEEFFKEYESCYEDRRNNTKLVPMTLEGCVVRLSDLIAYLGRDVEDAIRLKIITKKDIPTKITKVLGTNNKEIVNTLILDVIKNSKDKGYIALSNDVYEALSALKKFNYEHIYAVASPPSFIKEIDTILTTLFNQYLKDLEENNEESNIIKSYLNNLSNEYKNNNTKARIVLDYIAGMTDEYARKEYHKIINSCHTKEEVENEI